MTKNSLRLPATVFRVRATESMVSKTVCMLPTTDYPLPSTDPYVPKSDPTDPAFVRWSTVLSLALLLAFAQACTGAADDRASDDAATRGADGTRAASTAADATSEGEHDDATSDSAPRLAAPADLESDGGDAIAEGGGASGSNADADATATSSTIPDAETATATGPGRLSRLTLPGCCTRPSFAADGRSLLFIDRPDPAAPTGIYEIGIDAPGSAPVLRTDEIAYYLGDLTYRLDLSPGRTSIMRLADGEAWDLPSGGRPVYESPELRQVAWTSAPDVNFENRTATVWVAPFTGGPAREITRLPRGSLLGWLDEAHLLVRGRDQLADEDDILWVLRVADGRRTEVTRGARLRETRLSPDRRRLAWLVTQREDPADNGLFTIDLGPALDASTADRDAGEGSATPDSGSDASTDASTDTSTESSTETSTADTADPPSLAPPSRLDLPFGAYAWRDGDRLLLIPLEPGRNGMRLLEHDLVSGETKDRTPVSEPFQVDSGDWTVSPDGSLVAFVSAGDRAIWLIALD